MKIRFRVIDKHQLVCVFIPFLLVCDMMKRKFSIGGMAFAQVSSVLTPDLLSNIPDHSTSIVAFVEVNPSTFDRPLSCPGNSLLQRFHLTNYHLPQIII